MGRFDTMAGLVTEAKSGATQAELEKALTGGSAGARVKFKSYSNAKRVAGGFEVSFKSARDAKALVKELGVGTTRKHTGQGRFWFADIPIAGTVEDAPALTPDSKSTGLFDKLIGLTEASASSDKKALAFATQWLGKITGDINRTAKTALSKIAWPQGKAEAFRAGMKKARQGITDAQNALTQTSVGIKEDDGEDELAEASSPKARISKRVRMIQDHALAGAAAVRDIRNEVAKPTAYEKKLFKKAGDALASIQSVAGSMHDELRKLAEGNTPSGGTEDAVEGGARAAEPVADSRSDGSGQPGGEGHRMTPLPTPWQEESAELAEAVVMAKRVKARMDMINGKPGVALTLDSKTYGLSVRTADTLAIQIKQAVKTAHNAEDVEDGEALLYETTTVGTDTEIIAEQETTGATPNLSIALDEQITELQEQASAMIAAGALPSPTALDTVSAALGLDDVDEGCNGKPHDDEDEDEDEDADGEAHGDDEMEEEEQEEASASDADADDTEEETRGEQERAATTAEADPQAEADDEQQESATEGSVFERLAGLVEEPGEAQA